MLNMGDGCYTAARCYEHVSRMVDLFSELGGIQQLGTGPAAREANEEWADYQHAAGRFIRDLSLDLGVDLDSLLKQVLQIHTQMDELRKERTGK